MHGEQPLPQQSDRDGSTGGIGGASTGAAGGRDMADRTKPSRAAQTAEDRPEPAMQRSD